MAREIIAEEIHEGLRVDAFLSDILGESRNRMQKAIEDEEISLSSGKVLQKNHRVKAGEVFLCDLAEAIPLTAEAEDIPLDVMYEDDAVIVINKPRGMVVHPAPGHSSGTLVNALLHHCKDSLSGIAGVMRPGIVHRIDKDTSGLIIVAKHDLAHNSLTKQLQERTLERLYEAIVIGRVGKDAGEIDLAIGRHPNDRKRMSTQAKVSRPAKTSFRVLSRYHAYSHIECTLETGRTHQIRVHLASIGHPVLGDMVYGRKKPEKGLSGQCLHAKMLAFDHPVTGERITITSELPPYFIAAMEKLGNVQE